jgi:hypothetical protein
MSLRRQQTSPKLGGDSDGNPLKKRKSTMKTNEFIDYSNLLMDIEKLTKSLHDKCLHKRYEGYLSDISVIQSKLTLLAVWMSKEKEKQ